MPLHDIIDNRSERNGGSTRYPLSSRSELEIGSSNAWAEEN
jgi:hypothetical protein